MVAKTFAVECLSDVSHFIQPIILHQKEYLTARNLTNKRQLALLKPNVLLNSDSEAGCLKFMFRLNILRVLPPINLWR